MFTHESGKRSTSAADRAEDHLCAAAVSTCSPEDIAAAIRVLDAMADQAHLEPLIAQMTRDPAGNPIMDTPERRLAQATFSYAHDLADRAWSLAGSLRNAVSNTAP